MEKYVKPSLDVINLEQEQSLLCASGDTRNVPVGDWWVDEDEC